jgi:hypothetical protein
MIAGAVRYNGVGERTGIREELAWYSHLVWLYLLARISGLTLQQLATRRLIWSIDQFSGSTDLVEAGSLHQALRQPYG